MAPGRHNSWQQAKQAKLHSHPLPSKTKGTFDSSGFSAERDLNFGVPGIPSRNMVKARVQNEILWAEKRKRGKCLLSILRRERIWSTQQTRPRSYRLQQKHKVREFHQGYTRYRIQPAHVETDLSRQDLVVNPTFSADRETHQLPRTATAPNLNKLFAA